MKKEDIKHRAEKNKLSFCEQCRLEIHCKAENIINEIEKQTHNEFTKHRASEDYILKETIEILDVSLLNDDK